MKALSGKPPVARVAVTVPPAAWFHGISRAMYETYRSALVELGIEVFDVPLEALLPPDHGALAGLIEDLKAFRPELAFGLPFGSLALVSRMAEERDGWRPNLFTDILDIPTVCFWDHAPFELAEQLLTPHPATEGQSRAGTLATLRRALAHPRVLHWSRDSGQTRLMREFGLLSEAPPISEMTPVLPGRPDPAHAPGPSADVAFIGHFYHEPGPQQHPALAQLADEAIGTWLQRGGALWDVLADGIAHLAPAQRGELALDSDQTFFWAWAHRTIVHRSQTVRRLKILGEAGVPVACYGNLRTDLPGRPRNLLPVPGHIPFGPRLVATLIAHPIAVDVLSPGFIHGVSHKIMQTFGAGGFILVDRKRDFVDAFGDVGEAVSYEHGADLADKIDLYLGKPGLRREVAAEMRRRIAPHALGDVLTRVLAEAAAQSRPRKPPSSPPPMASVPEIDLLPRMRRHLTWDWRTVGFRRTRSGVSLSCTTADWGYAARVTLPQRATRLREPHVRFTVDVRQGRLGIGLLNDPKATPTGERYAGPGRRPVTMVLELPRGARPTLLLRKTSDVPLQAMVSEAVLCDRPV